MPADPVFVAVDVGTTGARACAVDLRGRVVAQRRRPYRTRVPRPGWAEQDPDDWTTHAVEALRGLPPTIRRRVRALGLTGQCPTIAPVDRRCRPVGPGLLYRDNRATEEAEELAAKFGVEWLHRRTGHSPAAFHSGAKVLWWRRRQPEVFAAAHLFLQPRDLVLHRLTGAVLTDESHAAATLFFDLVERHWALDILDVLGLDRERFPEVVSSWTIAGALSKAAAEEVGLASGMPVVIGAGDSQCAAFGAGVVATGPVSEMSGSSSCINTAVRAPLADVHITHYAHVVPGWYTTEVGLNTTGAAIAWAVHTLGFAGYEAFAEAASRGRARVERIGLTAAPLFLPQIGDGERDDPTACGMFTGLSDRHDRSALAYAVVEGVAAAVAGRVDLLHEGGAAAEELRVAGGGARLAVLGQAKADQLRVPVLHLRADTTGTGVAMLAAHAVGFETEATAAIAAGLAAGDRFVPRRRAADVVAARRHWYERLRASSAAHGRGEEQP